MTSWRIEMADKGKFDWTDEDAKGMQFDIAPEEGASADEPAGELTDEEREFSKWSDDMDAADDDRAKARRDAAIERIRAAGVDVDDDSRDGGPLRARADAYVLAFADEISKP
jgi:hypothetical protein